ncbi:ANTAR domain-containing protein [Streptomyces sp. NPDC048172]|uniref:ANTAR domain-containing protein n=1 Tax=Streptomyces sp. NPDC048172 TaxID=3365505 RepID=UPI00371CA0EF
MAALLHTLRDSAPEQFVGGDPREYARVLGVDGVAVSLAAGDRQSELVWSTPGVSARLDDLQFTLGEGPGVEALQSLSLVLEHDLGRVPRSRWPMLLPELTALAVGAVFCFPLRVGAAGVGVLTLHRGRTGALSPAEMDDALVLGAALTGVVLDGDARAGNPEGEDGSGLHRVVVHQASGMVSVQAGVPVAQALLLLRAHAYRYGRTVVEVAEDVVARRLRFRDDGQGTGPAVEVRG